MKPNTGTTDKIIRVILAFGLGALYCTQTLSGIGGIVSLLIGGILVLTAAIGFCPIYSLLGISSCRVNKQKSQ